ncbi:MAG: hypothetical protein Q7T68_16545 [Sphingopyxis sp.]|nr:hypothetical protein [Sphingopyxis sp.]
MDTSDAMPSRTGLSPAVTRQVASGLAQLMPAASESDAAGAGGFAADRHSLRFALMARFLPQPSAGEARSAVASSGPMWFAPPPAAHAVPGRGKPFWIRRQLAGWSLGGWLYVRAGDAPSQGGIAAASQVGGSQAGLRLGYGFGDSGRARAYGRATMAIREPQQREIAFGIAFAPIAHLPIDVAVEQRVAAGKDGRTALAAMVSGGVGDVGLPGGFRLDAYGQAGLVGARQRDGFADGAVVIDRRLGPDEATPLRLGALAAGAVQPGAARVDVGPRLTLRLPNVGQGSRIALDWRQRVAGDAHPESGAALTLAADF